MSLLRAITWDGVLPLVVASLPVISRLVLPPGHFLTFAVVLLTPVMAAIVRASLGVEQIARAAGRPAPLHRQLAFAAAVVMLFVFEIFVGVLVTADDGPPSAWLLPSGAYVIYLVLVAVALRPARNAAQPPTRL